MDTRRFRAKADDLLRRHGDKIDKGLASAERVARKRVRGNPARTRQVDHAAGKVREALARQRSR